MVVLLDIWQIVFVSSDRNQEMFNEYFGTMPWKALEFGTTSAERAALSRLCEVEGIPTLALINTRSGEVVTTSARELVLADPEGFPWPPKPVSSIDMAVNSINEKKTAILFVDRATSSTSEIEKRFQEVAETMWKDADRNIVFAVARESDATSDRIRAFLELDDSEGADSVRVIVTDIEEGLRYEIGTSMADLLADGNLGKRINGIFTGATDPSPLK